MFKAQPIAEDENMMRAPGPPVDPLKILDEAIRALNTESCTLPVADVDRALRSAPNDYRLWHVKGLIHRELEQRELAIPALRRAVSLAPKEPLVAHGYARTLLEAGLPCVDEFAHALKLASTNSDVVKGYVTALRRVGRGDEAIEGLAALVDRFPLWVDGHRLLAELRWTTGERADFTRSFDEALCRHRGNLELRSHQLTALLHAGELARVSELVAEGRLACGSQPIFTLSDAIVQSEAGRTDAADMLFSALAPLGNATFDLRHVRHFLRSGRPAEAAAVIDKWLGKAESMQFLPYAHSAWRMTDDARLEWLLANEALVGVYDLTNRVPPLDSLASLLRDLHRFEGQLLVQSVRGGSQTDGNLFHRIEPEIVALREAARAVTAEHALKIAELPKGHPNARTAGSPIAFSGAWSVRLEAGGKHANHVHPMGWLSSAIYITLPPDLGEDDHAGWLVLGEPDSDLGLNLPPSRLIEPRAGQLVLFPSWLWHGTRPFGEGERITVAFDVAR